MCPNSIHVGLKVVPIWVLWGQSIYYLGTWALRITKLSSPVWYAPSHPPPSPTAAGRNGARTPGRRQDNHGVTMDIHWLAIHPKPYVC